jgi:outer membrane beta-barrel protein
MRSWSMLLTLLVTWCWMSTDAYGADRDDEGDEGGSTIVVSRGPEKHGLQVRNKFFRKKGRFEITPNLGYVTNNEFNQDFTGGIDFAIHLSERFGIEFGGMYAFLGGTNQKDLAAAVLSLTDPNKLESTDPGLFVHAGILWSPMYGKINPFGLSVINLDFFFALGLGYAYEEIEVLAMDWGTSSAVVDQAFQNHLVPFHLGVGVKIFASRGFSLRIDGRFYLTLDQILDFKDPRAAQANRNLLSKNEYTNRLDCGQTDEAHCVTTLASTFIVSLGGSIWVPKMRAED